MTRKSNFCIAFSPYHTARFGDPMLPSGTLFHRCRVSVAGLMNREQLGGQLSGDRVGKMSPAGKTDATASATVRSRFS
jgi:hypothetical protein